MEKVVVEEEKEGVVEKMVVEGKGEEGDDWEEAEKQGGEERRLKKIGS